MVKNIKKFDPMALAQETQVMHSAIDSDGETVNFHFLSWGDLQELNEYAKSPEYSLRLLHRMLTKAYPDLTFEKLKAVPPKKLKTVLDLLLKTQGLENKEPLKKEDQASVK